MKLKTVSTLATASCLLLGGCSSSSPKMPTTETAQGAWRVGQNDDGELSVNFRQEDLTMIAYTEHSNSGEQSVVFNLSRSSAHNIDRAFTEVINVNGQDVKFSKRCTTYQCVASPLSAEDKSYVLRELNSRRDLRVRITYGQLRYTTIYPTSGFRYALKQKQMYRGLAG